MNLKTKHIVIVSSEFPPQPGGIGNHTYNLAKALNNEGYQVNVITDQRSDSGREEARFDQNLAYTVWRIKRRKWRVFMYIARVIRIFKALKKADCVIASGKFSLWAVALCTLFRKRFALAVVHGTEVNLKSKGFRKLVEIALKRFDTIVAVSNYTKDLMAHLNVGVAVIPNGILLSDWQENVSEPIDKLIGHPKLITVGRVSERKGQDEVVRALPELLKQFPKLHYHCIGIDDEATPTMQLAKRLNVEQYVSFHGVLDNETLKGYLAQGDIFVMLSKPSKTGDVEGFGIAILEANAKGMPAIGAFGSGVEDAIEEGQSGILISFGGVNTFVTAVKEILENKEHYKQGAIDWAKNHDWTFIVKQYIQLLP